MKKLLAPFLVLSALVAGCSGKDAEELNMASFDGTTFTASDGTTVVARLVPATGNATGVILMFHQAGSNMHEYDPIALRVAEWGWDCLKVDLRSGGDMWDEANLTRSQFSKDQSFSDAYLDMEAALEWAVGKEYEKIVVWGSSYSASLVLKLAAENPSVAGVVSCSPDEYRKLYPGGTYSADGTLVADWNAQIEVTVFFTATFAEIEGGLRDIYEAAPKTEEREKDIMVGHRLGVHGSSAFREDRNSDSSDLYWTGLRGYFDVLEGKIERYVPTP